MKSVTLQFTSLETLGTFVKAQEGGCYTNIRKLTVKGSFPQESIAEACAALGAQVIDKHVNGEQSTSYQMNNDFKPL